MTVKYSDDFLASLELKQDLLYDRIPIDQRGEYINAALAQGRQHAEQCQHGSLTSLFAAAGIELEEKQKSGRLFTTKLRAQYEDDQHGHIKVTYYRQSIEELAELADIGYEQALNIHLAHEYFHYLELQDTHPVNEVLPPVQLPSLFGWKRKAAIMRTSEIAANAFAKTFLRLSILPNYYDYRYLMSKGEIDQDWLDQALRAYQEEENPDK
jgi:hypothetical protein